MNNDSLLLDNGEVLENELLKLLDAEVEKSSTNIDANYISSITYILDKLRGKDSIPKEYSLENFVNRFNAKYGTHLKSKLSDSNLIWSFIISVFIVAMLSMFFCLYRYFGNVD